MTKDTPRAARMMKMAMMMMPAGMFLGMAASAAVLMQDFRDSAPAVHAALTDEALGEVTFLAQRDDPTFQAGSGQPALPALGADLTAEEIEDALRDQARVLVETHDALAAALAEGDHATALVLRTQADAAKQAAAQYRVALRIKRATG